MRGGRPVSAGQRTDGVPGGLIPPAARPPTGRRAGARDAPQRRPVGARRPPRAHPADRAQPVVGSPAPPISWDFPVPAPGRIPPGREAARGVPAARHRLRRHVHRAAAARPRQAPQSARRAAAVRQHPRLHRQTDGLALGRHTAAARPQRHPGPCVPAARPAGGCGRGGVRGGAGHPRRRVCAAAAGDPAGLAALRGTADAGAGAAQPRRRGADAQGGPVPVAGAGAQWRVRRTAAPGRRALAGGVAAGDRRATGARLRGAGGAQPGGVGAAGGGRRASDAGVAGGGPDDGAVPGGASVGGAGLVPPYAAAARR